MELPLSFVAVETFTGAGTTTGTDCGVDGDTEPEVTPILEQILTVKRH